jgi:hypothetical protein
MQESNCIDNSQEDGSDDEDLIMETEELRTKSLQQVVEGERRRAARMLLFGRIDPNFPSLLV